MAKKEDFCVTNSYTIKEVLEVLEQIRERGVVVLGESDKVCGVLSQGDIINALANGKSMYTSISNAFSTDFIFLTEKDIRKGFEIIKNRNLCLLPILDRDGKLAEVLTARELLKYAKFRDDRDEE